MLDESAVGLSVEQDFSYTWRDLILYNLSVGANQEELEYVYERDLKAYSENEELIQYTES